jgi:hypothetical protein
MLPLRVLDLLAITDVYAFNPLQSSPYVFGMSMPNTMIMDGLIPILQRQGVSTVSMVYSVNDPYTMYVWSTC